MRTRAASRCHTLMTRLSMWGPSPELCGVNGHWSRTPLSGSTAVTASGPFLPPHHAYRQVGCLFCSWGGRGSQDSGGDFKLEGGGAQHTPPRSFLEPLEKKPRHGGQAMHTLGLPECRPHGVSPSVPVCSRGRQSPAHADKTRLSTLGANFQFAVTFQSGTFEYSPRAGVCSQGTEHTHLSTPQILKADGPREQACRDLRGLPLSFCLSTLSFPEDQKSP